MLSKFLQSNRVVVHLGAHKTATTYIQDVLAANRVQLAQRKVALILPSELRKNTSPNLMQDDHGESAVGTGKIFEHTNFLLHEYAASEVSKIVVSEENFIGSSNGNLTSGKLYPKIVQRLTRLPAELDNPNVTLLLALRNYGSFVSSNLTTAIRRGEIFDQGEVRTAFILMIRNWLDIINEIKTVFPHADLKVWRFEDFSDLEARVLNEFSFDLSIPTGHRPNSTMSAMAMRRATRLIRKHGPESETRKMIKRAINQFPVSTKNPRYSLWSQEQEEHLGDLYRVDWQEIRSAYPKVELV